MKKRFLIVLAILGLMLILTACATGGVSISAQKVQMDRKVEGAQGVGETQEAAGTNTGEAAGKNAAQSGGITDLQAQPVAAAARAEAVPVLYYHSVMIQAGNELRMPPAQFEEQMSYLASHGYHDITPQELEQFLRGRGQLPTKPFMITFDDGYADNYTNALPILQKFKFTALVFMVSSYVDGSGYLSGSQLKSLVSAGWTIGGHTVNHVNLAKLDGTAQTRELLDSKKFLEKLTGQPVWCFAYPFGAYNTEIIEQLQKADYQLAFTTERGWALRDANPFLIQRVYCYANMGLREFIRRIENPQY